MISVGVDIQDISRMAQSMKSDRFLSRVFSKKELLMFEKRSFSAQTVTANFCAKEAFSKALGTGVRGFKLCEVSVLRDELGKPYFEFDGNAAKLAENRRFSVSLSHTADTAIAFVVAEDAD